MIRSRTGAILSGVTIVVSLLTSLGAMVGIHRHPVDNSKSTSSLHVVQGEVSNSERWEKSYQEGDALYRAGRYEEAYKCWAECLSLIDEYADTSTQSAGEQLDRLQKLSVIYKTQQKPELAIACYQHAVAIATTAYGKDDVRVANLLLDLGRMYTFYDQVKSYSKADETLSEAFRINEQIYGKCSIPTGDVAIALAQLKDKEIDYATAAQYWSLAIDIGNKLEPNDISCCRIGPRQGLAGSYEKLGRFSDALKVQQELIVMCRTGAKNFLPTVIRSCAGCLQKMGRTEEAKELLLELKIQS